MTDAPGLLQLDGLDLGDKPPQIARHKGGEYLEHPVAVTTDIHDVVPLDRLNRFVRLQVQAGQLADRLRRNHDGL